MNRIQNRNYPLMILQGKVFDRISVGINGGILGEFFERSGKLDQFFKEFLHTIL